MDLGEEDGSGTDQDQIFGLEVIYRDDESASTHLRPRKAQLSIRRLGSIQRVSGGNRFASARDGEDDAVERKGGMFMPMMAR